MATMNLEHATYPILSQEEYTEALPEYESESDQDNEDDDDDNKTNDSQNHHLSKSSRVNASPSSSSSVGRNRRRRVDMYSVGQSSPKRNRGRSHSAGRSKTRVERIRSRSRPNNNTKQRIRQQQQQQQQRLNESCSSLSIGSLIRERNQSKSRRRRDLSPRPLGKNSSAHQLMASPSGGQNSTREQIRLERERRRPVTRSKSSELELFQTKRGAPTAAAAHQSLSVLEGTKLVSRSTTSLSSNQNEDSRERRRREGDRRQVPLSSESSDLKLFPNRKLSATVGKEKSRRASMDMKSKTDTKKRSSSKKRHNRRSSADDEVMQRKIAALFGGEESNPPETSEEIIKPSSQRPETKPKKPADTSGKPSSQRLATKTNPIDTIGGKPSSQRLQTKTKPIDTTGNLDLEEDIAKRPNSEKPSRRFSWWALDKPNDTDISPIAPPVPPQRRNSVATVGTVDSMWTSKNPVAPVVPALLEEESSTPKLLEEIKPSSQRPQTKKTKEFSSTSDSLFHDEDGGERPSSEKPIKPSSQRAETKTKLTDDTSGNLDQEEGGVKRPKSEKPSRRFSWWALDKPNDTDITPVAPPVPAQRRNSMATVDSMKASSHGVASIEKHLERTSGSTVPTDIDSGCWSHSSSRSKSRRSTSPNKDGTTRSHSQQRKRSTRKEHREKKSNRRSLSPSKDIKSHLQRQKGSQHENPDDLRSTGTGTTLDSGSGVYSSGGSSTNINNGERRGKKPRSGSGLASKKKNRGKKPSRRSRSPHRDIESHLHQQRGSQHDQSEDLRSTGTGHTRDSVASGAYSSGGSSTNVNNTGERRGKKPANRRSRSPRRDIESHLHRQKGGGSQHDHPEDLRSTGTGNTRDTRDSGASGAYSSGGSSTNINNGERRGRKPRRKSIKDHLSTKNDESSKNRKNPDDVRSTATGSTSGKRSVGSKQSRSSNGSGARKRSKSKTKKTTRMSIKKPALDRSNTSPKQNKLAGKKLSEVANSTSSEFRPFGDLNGPSDFLGEDSFHIVDCDLHQSMTSWRQDKKGVEKMTTTSNETSHDNNRKTTRHRASRSDEIPEPFLVTPPRSRSKSMDDPFVLDASHDDDDDGFAFDDDPFADFDGMQQPSLRF